MLMGILGTFTENVGVLTANVRLLPEADMPDLSAFDHSGHFEVGLRGAMSTERLRLFAIATAIAIGLALGERLVFAAALDRPVDLSEPDVLVMNAARVSIPFLLLAARSSARLVPWLIVLSATVALHWWWLGRGIGYHQAPDGSGVDMFGALVMLVSPLPLAALAVALDVAIKRRR